MTHLTIFFLLCLGFGCVAKKHQSQRSKEARQDNEDDTPTVKSGDLDLMKDPPKFFRVKHVSYYNVKDGKEQQTPNYQLTYTYDTQGRYLSVQSTDFLMSTTTENYEWDEKGHLSRLDEIAKSMDSSTQKTVKYSYNDKGLLTSIETTTDAKGKKTLRTKLISYDKNAKATDIKTTEGSAVVETLQIDRASKTLHGTFLYDPAYNIYSSGEIPVTGTIKYISPEAGIVESMDVTAKDGNYAMTCARKDSTLDCTLTVSRGSDKISEFKFKKRFWLAEDDSGDGYEQSIDATVDEYANNTIKKETNTVYKYNDQNLVVEVKKTSWHLDGTKQITDATMKTVTSYDKDGKRPIRREDFENDKLVTVKKYEY